MSKTAKFGSNPPIEVPEGATESEVRVAMESIFPEVRNASIVTTPEGNFEFQEEFATKG